MTQYRTLYIDNDGSVFVGETWEAHSVEEYDNTVAKEMETLKDISSIEKIQICEVIDTVRR